MMPARTNSMRSSMRNKVGRALSFDGSGPGTRIKKAFSFDRVKRDKSKINASDNAQADDIWDGLRHIKTSKNVTNVEISDLLLSTVHKDMLPMVQEMAFSCPPSQKFLFSDTMEIEKFDTWRNQKDRMMDAYKRSLKQRNDVPGAAVAWHAEVTIPSGTMAGNMEDLLSTLQGDLSCSNVSFAGTSFNEPSNSKLPQLLCSLIDGETLLLTEEIAVHVAYGRGEDDKWLKLLDQCTVKLSKLLAKKGKGTRSSTSPMRRTKTVDAPTATEKPAVPMRRSQTLGAERARSVTGDDKSMNTSATSLSSASTASASSKSRVVAKPTLLEESAGSSGGKKKGENTGTDVKSMLAEKPALTWKEFGDMHKARLRRTRSLDAQQAAKMPTAA